MFKYKNASKGKTNEEIRQEMERLGKLKKKRCVLAPEDAPEYVSPISRGWHTEKPNPNPLMNWIDNGQK